MVEVDVRGACGRCRVRVASVKVVTLEREEERWRQPEKKAAARLGVQQWCSKYARKYLTA